MAPRSDNFLSVKQVAAYLQLNEKKVYALVNEGRMPATKVTGKWMFPRELIDRWMLDSAHGGLLTDRLAIAGSDDPLLFRVLTGFARDVDTLAQVSYTPTGARLGLELLQANRVDVSALHWGPLAESRTRHPALLRQHSQHHNWVLIRAFTREQGLMLRRDLAERLKHADAALRGSYRWVQRQPGAGSQRFLMEMRKLDPGYGDLNATTVALTQREAAAAIVLGQADVAPGVRSAATEAGLAFLPFGVEAFDLALPRGVWFRRLFQDLLSRLQSGDCRQTADLLGGYDFTDCGEMIWGQE
ncbi:MAG: helix-turn-helix transcriptional regulator [Gammaproteobacteria bacterium]|nr:helix-turn-helix transcriptional regulator [Gammaproteobacteria bacterium]MCB1925761.1 helix-turn-helix transcriptional regulator [Gammaproteobacteria bacterium]